MPLELYPEDEDECIFVDLLVWTFTFCDIHRPPGFETPRDSRLSFLRYQVLSLPKSLALLCAPLGKIQLRRS